MAIDLQKFTKGKNFSSDFIFDDPTDKIVIVQATDTVQGKVALNQGNSLPADATNSTDALTAVGFTALANASTVNPVQQAVVNAVEAALSADAGAIQAIATALPVGTDTVQGKISLAVEANYPSTVDTEAATPGFVNKAISEAVAAGATPIATDTIQGKVALNLGTSLPGDATNATDALTASGVTTLMNDTTVAGGNAVQKSVVNAMEAALGSDATAQVAIATALKEEIHADFPVATDTIQGKVALNLGNTLPADATNATDALTATGFNALANSATINATQQAVVNAVEKAIGSDAGAIQAINDALPAATDTVQGKVSLAVAANHPSTSDVEAVTPAYLNAALASAAPNVAAKDEGTSLTASMTSINFVGSGAKATATGSEVTVTMSGTATVSDTAPANPFKDLLWYDSTLGRLFVYTGSVWVDANPAAVAEDADGSETKLAEGDNITITGTGTTADPYEISASSAAPVFANSLNTTVTGAGTVADPIKVDTKYPNSTGGGESAQGGFTRVLSYQLPTGFTFGIHLLSVTIAVTSDTSSMQTGTLAIIVNSSPTSFDSTSVTASYASNRRRIVIPPNTPNAEFHIPFTFAATLNPGWYVHVFLSSGDIPTNRVAWAGPFGGSSGIQRVQLHEFAA